MKNTVIFTKSKTNQLRVDLDDVIAYDKVLRKNGGFGTEYGINLYMQSTIIVIPFSSEGDRDEAVEYMDDFKTNLKEI